MTLTSLPPMAFTMPSAAFEVLLAYKGVRLTWSKSHSCPCAGGGSNASGGYRNPGTADPSCQTCNGYGTYWDAPIGPFTGLLTYFASAPSPIEPGIAVDEKFGQHIETEPVVTIPNASPLNVANGTPAQQLAMIWEQASVFDLFVEVDALTRYNAILTQGENEQIPFQANLSVASTGAVTIYDPVSHAVVTVSGYTVTGPRVVLPTGVYPDSTPYTVEFTAAPMFVAHRKAGAFPHNRPFGNGGTLPKRFHIQTLDYWTRNNGVSAGTNYPPVSGF